MSNAMSTAAGRSTIAEYIRLQEIACERERLVQLCIVDHTETGHIHVKAHFSGDSQSPWQTIESALVADVREVLRLRGRNVFLWEMAQLPKAFGPEGSEP